MGMHRPLVSVVMPSMNQAQYIGAAVASVFGQDYEPIELWVADGGSTDDTLLKLEELQKSFGSRLRWISEPDSGPANAINKLLSLAGGHVIGWLNSDDMYASGAVARAVSRFGADPDLLMVYGQGDHVDDLGTLAARYPTRPPSASIEEFQAGCFICQPTVFFKRRFFDEIGHLDESLKTAFDFELWLRAFTQKPSAIGWVDEVQAYSRLHSTTITHRLRRTVAEEGSSLLARYLGYAQPHWFWTYLDELCAVFPFSGKGADHLPDIASEARDALATMKPNFDPAAVAEIEERLASDVRMHAFPCGVGAGIYSDGWAPEHLAIHVKRRGGRAAYLRVLCVHASPHPDPLVLRVQGSWGGQFVERVERRGTFMLNIAIPRTAGENVSILVRSSPVFTPPAPATGAADTRRLAFRAERFVLDD